MRLRAPSEQALEWRKRTGNISGRGAQWEEHRGNRRTHDLPVAAVARVLAPIEHPLISDPVQLLRVAPEDSRGGPTDVQLYWLGFLMVAGHIWGQGSSLALVVTLGEESREYMRPSSPTSRLIAFIAVLLQQHRGWQVYLPRSGLCKALFPWASPPIFTEMIRLCLTTYQRSSPSVHSRIRGREPALHPLVGQAAG